MERLRKVVINLIQDTKKYFEESIAMSDDVAISYPQLISGFDDDSMFFFIKKVRYIRIALKMLYCSFVFRNMIE